MERWSWPARPPGQGTLSPQSQTEPASQSPSASSSAAREITVINAGPPQLDQMSSTLGTSYKQVWGTLTLWANGQVSDVLVRNAITRMKNCTIAFQQACAAHGIDASDIPHQTDFVFALVEHCLTQPPSQAVVDTFTNIMRERNTPIEIYRMAMAKVDVWKARMGQQSPLQNGHTNQNGS